MRLLFLRHLYEHGHFRDDAAVAADVPQTA